MLNIAEYEYGDVIPYTEYYGPVEMKANMGKLHSSSVAGNIVWLGLLLEEIDIGSDI